MGNRRWIDDCDSIVDDDEPAVFKHRDALSHVRWKDFQLGVARELDSDFETIELHAGSVFGNLLKNENTIVVRE